MKSAATTIVEIIAFVKTIPMSSYYCDMFVHFQLRCHDHGTRCCDVKLFEGNSDSCSVQHSYVDEPFLARFVKFHTATWTRHPSMRVEIIGCQGHRPHRRYYRHICLSFCRINSVF